MGNENTRNDVSQQIFKDYEDADKRFSEVVKKTMNCRFVVFECKNNLPQKGDWFCKRCSNGWLVCHINNVYFGRGLADGFCVLGIVQRTDLDLKEARDTVAEAENECPPLYEEGDCIVKREIPS